MQKKSLQKNRESQIILKQELKNAFGSEEESKNENYLIIRKFNKEIRCLLCVVRLLSVNCSACFYLLSGERKIKKKKKGKILNTTGIVS